MVANDIELAPNISGFFEEVVQEAIRARRVEATQAATHYLVQLLAGYAQPNRAPDQMLSRPVTFLLRDALAATGAARFRQLRELGDGVLYLLGFFKGNVTRRGADRDYVLQVGSTAYGCASAMLRTGGSSSKGPDVLHELAGKFGRFVEVVSEVSDAALANCSRGDAALIKLYERWLTTGSERLAEELVASGMMPTSAIEGVN